MDMYYSFFLIAAIWAVVLFVGYLHHRLLGEDSYNDTLHVPKYKYMPSLDSKNIKDLILVRISHWEGGEHYEDQKMVKLSRSDIMQIEALIMEAYSFARDLIYDDTRNMAMNLTIEGMKEYVKEITDERKEWGKELNELLRFNPFVGDDKDTEVGKIIIRTINVRFNIEGKPVFLGRGTLANQFISYYYE